MDKSSQPEPAPAADRDAVGSDLIIPTAASLLTGYYMISTADLAWESKATGTVVGVCLLAMCVVHFARTAMKLALGKARLSFGGLFSPNRLNTQRVALLILAATFIAGIEWLGTTLGLFLLLIASMWVTGVRDLRQLVGIALAVSGTVYILLIGLLNSRLPRGILEKLIASVTGGAI